MDDSKLIREYVTQAFTELVNRHLNLVHSAAARQVHDSLLAEQVTRLPEGMPRVRPLWTVCDLRSDGF